MIMVLTIKLMQHEESTQKKTKNIMIMILNMSIRTTNTILHIGSVPFFFPVIHVVFFDSAPLESSSSVGTFYRCSHRSSVSVLGKVTFGVLQMDLVVPKVPLFPQEKEKQN